MRFDVLSRMCKAIGCFNVRTHPLFEGLNAGKRVWLCVLCMRLIDMWPTVFQVCRPSFFCECSRSTSKQARYHSPVWTVAVRDPCPGIHCFLRQEVCGDMFILCKGTPLTLQPFPPSLSAKRPLRRGVSRQPSVCRSAGSDGRDVHMVLQPHPRRRMFSAS